LSKQEDDFQTLAKGYEDISHAILDNIENKKKDKETEKQKKANMDNLLGVLHWFLDNHVVVPKRLAKFVGDSINNGTITHTIKYPRGYKVNKGINNVKVCLEIFKSVLGGLNENQAIEKYVKEHGHQDTMAIYQAIWRYGKSAKEIIPMVWDTPLTPEQSKSIDILVHTKEDKEFQDNKDFATSNPNSIKNKIFSIL